MFDIFHPIQNKKIFLTIAPGGGMTVESTIKEAHQLAKQLRVNIQFQHTALENGRIWIIVDPTNTLEENIERYKRSWEFSNPGAKYEDTYYSED